MIFGKRSSTEESFGSSACPQLRLGELIAFTGKPVAGQAVPDTLKYRPGRELDAKA
jgi:hypothetical protein